MQKMNDARSFRILIFILSVFALAGCSARRQEALNFSIDKYLLAIRRGNFEVASQWIQAKDRQEFLKNSEFLSSYTISHVQLEKMDTPSENQAEMSFLVELFSADESEVKTLHRKISWSYDPKLKTWWAMTRGPIGATR
jgi:hypothetical protein